MKLAEMREAGLLMKDGKNITDKQMRLMAKATKFALAYLSARGNTWNLATAPLSLELNQLESFLEFRKHA